MRRLGVHAEQSPQVREQYRCIIASFISVNNLSLTPGLIINSHKENITLATRIKPKKTTALKKKEERKKGIREGRLTVNATTREDKCQLARRAS